MTLLQIQDKINSAVRDHYNRDHRSPQKSLEDGYDITTLLPESKIQPTEYDVVVGLKGIKKSQNQHYNDLIKRVHETYMNEPIRRARAWKAHEVQDEIEKKDGSW